MSHRGATDTTDRRTSMRRLWSHPGAVLLLLAFALLPVLTPFTNPGFPAGHDAGAHLTYVYRMDHALSEGQFPVRWVEATKPGHGQPLFNFYQVGFSYLVALLHRVVPLSYALKAMPPLLWWTGAGFMYLLCRRFGRDRPLSPPWSMGSRRISSWTSLSGPPTRNLRPSPSGSVSSGRSIVC